MTAPSAQKADWRAWTPVVSNYPGGGSPPLSMDCAGGQSVLFSPPSVAALCLSIAQRAHNEALRIRKQLCSCSDTSARDALAYDYLERIIVSVTFSITALEAFANAVIGQSYAAGKHYKTEKDGAKVERWTDLDAKLTKVLPALVQGKGTPESEPFWTRYQNMVRLRDSWVVHAKTEWETKEAGKAKAWSRYSKEFWDELLPAGTPENYPEIAEKLIEWFVVGLDCWLNRMS